MGVYDDLANEDFAGRIVGWESSNGKNTNLCYFVVDEFHNLETETYRRKTFDRIPKVQFDAFEKVLFLSATAPAAIADGALRRVGFKGLEKPEPGLKATDTGDSSGGMTCYPTKLFNVIEEVPLGHVQKEFLKVADSSREAFKLLKAHARAVVAVGSRRKVEELSEEWNEHFRITWTHGHLKTGEKIGRIRSFMADKNSQVLLGTKLVTEGIDIRNLRMVIMMDCRPSIIEFIQAAGRLRSSGMFYLLSGTGARGESGEEKSDHPAVPLLEEGCVDEQMAEFYGPGVPRAPTIHAEVPLADSQRLVASQSEKASVAEVLLADSQKLVASHKRAMERLEMEQEITVRKRAANVPEPLALERKKIKRDFHEQHEYTDILLYLGLPKDMAADLMSAWSRDPILSITHLYQKGGMQKLS